jgi:N-acetylneuraminate synthase
VIQDADLTFKRPGTGIAPNESKYLIGQKLRHDLPADSVLRWEDLSR